MSGNPTPPPPYAHPHQSFPARPDSFFSRLHHIKHITCLTPIDENMTHCTIVYPILEAIMEAVDYSLGGEVKCPYNIGDACPTACKSRQPVTMLYSEGCHFACAAVRDRSSEMDAALDDAIEAAMLLTAKSGYSVIIIAVADTDVTMGLLSLLRLRSFPSKLRSQLYNAQVEIEDAIFADEKYSAENTLKYTMTFCANEVGNGFEDAFRKYLLLLAKSVCSGLSRGVVAKLLPDTVQGCRVVTCSKIPADLQLPGCSEGTTGNYVYKVFVTQTPSRADSIMGKGKGKGKVKHPFCASLIFARRPDEPESDDREEAKSAAFWREAFKHPDEDWLQARASKVPVNTGDGRAEPETTTATTQAAQGAHATLTEESDSEKSLAEEQLLTICCMYRHLDGDALTEKPSAVVAAKLLAMIAVLHDVYRFAHCDIRRSNVVVSGSTVELIGYEHASRMLRGAVLLPPDSTPCVVSFKRLLLPSLPGSDEDDDESFCEESELSVRLMDIVSFFDFIWLGIVPPEDGGLDSSSHLAGTAAGGDSYHTQVHDAIVSGVGNAYRSGPTPTRVILSRILAKPALKEVREVVAKYSLLERKSFAEVNAAA